MDQTPNIYISPHPEQPKETVLTLPDEQAGPKQNHRGILERRKIQFK
tara:strand:- start:680 stop:820 length:141 start_codon:yes stop_codon:yes gene_type:complete